MSSFGIPLLDAKKPAHCSLAVAVGDNNKGVYFDFSTWKGPKIFVNFNDGSRGRRPAVFALCWGEAGAFASSA